MPAVCSYHVIFSNGDVKYPKLPGHVDVYHLAESFAKSLGNGVFVISIESLD